MQQNCLAEKLMERRWSRCEVSRGSFVLLQLLLLLSSLLLGERYPKETDSCWFKVGEEADNYRLKIAGYRGTAGDALASGANRIDGMMFTTRNRDNDAKTGGNCASDTCVICGTGGGWWYNNCSLGKINMPRRSGSTFSFNWHWLPFANENRNQLLRSTMKLVRR